MTLSKLFLILKGSSKSGNFGHAGRKGKRGGSTSKSNIHIDVDKDGVTDLARVGVPAHDTPPPPGIPKLPNLTPREREVERNFSKAFENNPDKMTDDFLEIVKASGEPPTFGTDDAKVLTDEWSNPPPENRAQNRATLNTPLHATANAIAKRAFLKHLDTLKEGDEVLVTVGGCGAGKGFALKNVPEALEMKKNAKAVWDSAGDQNATENPWIQKELEKRGLKGNYVYVHANPETQWADPQRGVVKRAQDPNDGRMVDSKVFADSYAIGAKNHQSFYNQHKNNPNANFVFLDNTGKPKKIDRIPESALNLDARKLADFASNVLDSNEIPKHVREGGQIGNRIWPND